MNHSELSHMAGAIDGSTINTVVVIIIIIIITPSVYPTPKFTYIVSGGALYYSLTRSGHLEYNKLLCLCTSFRKHSKCSKGFPFQ